MTVIAGRLATTFPDSNTGWGARVISAQEQLVTTVRPALLLISAAVGFLLLIVCANVANLILARLSSRRGEIAVRAALGAGRMQLVRQVLAESFVLSGIGGALGLLVAWAGVRLVHALPEGSLPRMQDVRLDGGVLLFALRRLGRSSRSMFGLDPGDPGVARRTARHDERVLGHDAAFGRAAAQRARRRRGRAGADAARRRRADDAQLRAADARVARASSRAICSRCRSTCRRRSTRPASIARASTWTRSAASARCPASRSAAGVSALPMYPVGIDFALPFTIEGHAAPTNGEEPRADIRTATPGYFETMKIALLKGRFIDGRDRQGAPGTIVINETMARRYFAGEDPIGKVVRNPHGKGEVVGIVGDVKHYGLDSEPRAELFMPAWQQPLNGMALIVRDRVGSEGVRRQRSAARCSRSTPSSRSTTSARWSTSCRDRCSCRASACCCSARSRSRRCCSRWSGSTAWCRTR